MYELNKSGARRLGHAARLSLRSPFSVLTLVLAVSALVISLRSAPPAVAADGDEDPPVVVEMVVVERRDMPINVETLGTVQAFNTVLVRSRVDGRITRIRFDEGQDVVEGQVLAEIDARLLQAEVNRARALSARSAAQLQSGRREWQRIRNLAEQRLVAAQAIDTARSQVDELEQAAAANRAELQRAQVQLTETVIRAPLDGRAGARLVDAGNVVRADDERGLVSITQVHPISVVFSLPSDYLAQIRAGRRKAPLKVSALARDGEQVLAEGELVLIDNQIDAATGTVKLKATFANDDDALWPGQFVNVRLLLETRRAAIVVPEPAVQTGPEHRYVYSVGDDDHVHVQAVQVASCADGFCVLAAGLEPGIRVVTDGQHKLDEGMRVAAAPTVNFDTTPQAAAQ